MEKIVITPPDPTKQKVQHIKNVDMCFSPHRFTCMGFLFLSKGCMPGPHDFILVFHLPPTSHTMRKKEHFDFDRFFWEIGKFFLFYIFFLKKKQNNTIKISEKTATNTFCDFNVFTADVPKRNPVGTNTALNHHRTCPKNGLQQNTSKAKPGLLLGASHFVSG